MVRSPLWPTGFSMYASPLLFTYVADSIPRAPLRKRCNTRYRWVVSPYESSSCALPDRDLHPARSAKLCLAHPQPDPDAQPGGQAGQALDHHVPVDGAQYTPQLYLGRLCQVKRRPQFGRQAGRLALVQYSYNDNYMFFNMLSSCVDCFLVTIRPR